ncbi:putative biopolymer transport protein related to ExbD [Desulfosarcina variabilis str. Montpellier]|uniref:ExbD/TolR family protein n=1 Tax=Desulfosarcina variabilis TaxID=2300 RepID=UPI003AFB305F
MNKQYILRKKDKIYKPVALNVLRKWAYENMIHPGDMVSSDGGKTWDLAGKIPELMQFLPSKTPALSLVEVPRGYSGKIERKRRSIEVIDMIPMIDMVFLLLIFFALTSTFEVQRVMQMNLPEAATGEQLQKKQTLTLQIKTDGRIFLENNPIAVPDLESVLSEIVEQSAGVTLVIKGDAQVPHGKVVEMMDISNSAGVEKILITVKRHSGS